MRISDWSSDVCSSDLRQRPKATIDRRLGVILQETKALRDAQQDVLAQRRRLLSVIQPSLDDDKADDLVVIALPAKSRTADSMALATPRSPHQLPTLPHHHPQQQTHPTAHRPPHQ